MFPFHLLPYSFCSWDPVRFLTLQHGRRYCNDLLEVEASLAESKELSGSLTINLKPQASCDCTWTDASPVFAKLPQSPAINSHSTESGARVPFLDSLSALSSIHTSLITIWLEVIDNEVRYSLTSFERTFSEIKAHSTSSQVCGEKKPYHSLVWRLYDP